MNQPTDEALKKQQEFFERAKKGVLKHLIDKGQLSLGEMHEYSATKYFIQHQRFSQMMEFFVDEQMIDFDGINQTAVVTPKGMAFCQ